MLTVKHALPHQLERDNLSIGESIILDCTNECNHTYLPRDGSKVFVEQRLVNFINLFRI
jgi:hypothetical protein